MNLDRRMFAQLFAGLPFFGPAAAQEVASVSQMSAGIAVAGMRADLSPSIGENGPTPVRSLPKMSAASAIKKGLLARKDIEEAIRQEMQVERIYDLDIDLQVNKSLAMNAKLRIQRERVLQRRVEGYFKGDGEYNNVHQLLIGLAKKHLWSPEDHQYEKERNARNNTEADSDW